MALKCKMLALFCPGKLSLEESVWRMWWNGKFLGLPVSGGVRSIGRIFYQTLWVMGMVSQAKFCLGFFLQVQLYG